MDYCLTDAPHHCVKWHHTEAAVLVDKCDGGRGEEAKGAGNDGPHEEQHHAIELAKFVAAEHAEGDNRGNAVEEHGRDKAPHEHCQPVIMTVFKELPQTSNKT